MSREQMPCTPESCAKRENMFAMLARMLRYAYKRLMLSARPHCAMCAGAACFARGLIVPFTLRQERKHDAQSIRAHCAMFVAMSCCAQRHAGLCSATAQGELPAGMYSCRLGVLCAQPHGATCVRNIAIRTTNHALHASTFHQTRKRWR